MKREIDQLLDNYTKELFEDFRDPEKADPEMVQTILFSLIREFLTLIITKIY